MIETALREESIAIKVQGECRKYEVGSSGREDVVIEEPDESNLVCLLRAHCEGRKAWTLGNCPMIITEMAWRDQEEGFHDFMSCAVLP